MSLSSNLKHFRLERRMTQEQLAHMLGVSAQAVSKWETSETYPDGALLVPIARALGVSLDTLFDNDTCSISDISMRIRSLMQCTSADKRMITAREIAWQTVRALFNCYMKIDGGYAKEEKTTKSSHIVNNSGFTYASNGRVPFVSFFPENGENFSKVIGTGEEMRKIFAALSSRETMRAVLFIHKKDPKYVFEAEVLAESCKIKPEDIGRVLDDLLSLGIISRHDIEIDGIGKTLYYAQPSEIIIALLIFAHEINYKDGYCLSAHARNKPYLK